MTLPETSFPARFRAWIERRLRRAMRVVARHLSISCGPFELSKGSTDADTITFGMRQEIQFVTSESWQRVADDLRERIR